MGSVRSISILTLLNTAGAAVAVLTSVVTAHYFGTTRALEVFFAASTLEVLINKLTQTGQLAEIFLPIYHRIKHEHGIKLGHAAFSVLTNWMLCAVGAVAGLMWLAAPPLVGLLVPGFGQEDRRDTVQMFRALSALLPLQVLTSQVQTLANAERWFGGPEAVQVGSRVLSLVTISLLAGRWGPWVMVVSLWISYLSGAVGLIWLVGRMGYRHRFLLRCRHFSVRAVFGSLASTWGYVGATQVYAYVLNAALSCLPQGTFAVFNYVQQLYARSNSVALRPVSVVFFTRVSEAIARGAEDVRRLGEAALGQVLAIGSLCVAAIWAAGEPLLSGLWGGRRFGPEQVKLASLLLQVMFLLLLVGNLGLVLRKVNMSLGRVHQQYWTASLAQVVSAAAAWPLIRHFGLAGTLAILALNELLLATAAVWVLRRSRLRLFLLYPWQSLLAWATAVVVGVVGAHLFAVVVGDSLGLAGRPGRLIAGALFGSVAVILALAGAWGLRVPEVRWLVMQVAVRLGLTAPAVVGSRP